MSPQNAVRESREIAEEARRRFHLNPIFHAQVTTAVQVLTQAYPPGPDDDPDRLVAERRMAAAVALITVERYPIR